MPAVFLVVLASVVGFGLAGRGVEGPPKPTVPAAIAPIATPSAAPRPSYEPCPAPRLPAVVDPIPRHPAELVPTGLAAVAVPAPGPSLLVADRDGSLWEDRRGRLLHLLRSGAREAWTIADDAAFDTRGIAPALGGGVWMFGAGGVRWFDGRGFRDIVPAPDDEAIIAVAEAPDGSLWARTSLPSPLRWDGTAWGRVDDCATIPYSFSVSAVAVDTDGGVWVARYDPGGRGGAGETLLAHLDAGAWSHYGPADSPALKGAVLVMEPAIDGSMWVGTTAGIVRIPWSGEAVSYGDELAGTIAISPRPDGTAVVATAGTSANWYAYTLRVVSPSSTTSDGLAGLVQVPGWLSVRETAAGLFASSWEDLFELEGGHRVAVAEYAGPLSPARIVALSATSAWIGYESGIGFLSADGWATNPPEGSLIPARDLARDPHGRIWAATDVGVAVHADGRWLSPAGAAAVTVCLAPDGTAWVGTAASTVEHVRLVGPDLVADSAGRLPFAGVQSMAVGRNGTIWAASASDGLARYDGRAWTKASPLDWPRTAGATDVAIAPNGDVWAALVAQPGAGTAILARLHGNEWTVWDEHDGVPPTVSSIAVAPDGTVWAAGNGLGRFDGRRWSSGLVGLELGPLSIAPDGTVLVPGPGGIYRVASWP